ncbi:MAG: Holliday junction branch migration protein RuvA [Actinomycetota bacterium]|jgi:Holliday junction DNA helicase RuvA|nr:Holliday junction branch migration protein RuvA [Acidimicrobiaceae bacterium]MEC9034069.1 Holliday junction branch migration protein RuvA [Actinomycetota bacterium]MEE2646284.1 Holliday junction branch migration protein RuvA [Actinomycetota bacterium]|tara:strand:+ start:2126 stop:2719 length:594 start_codon:yes stop_codon:yes gene_type:complete
MIGSLRGVLQERLEDGQVLVEVAGVGYRVTVTPTTSVSVGEVGQEIFLHIHHHFRESDQTLFGFLSRQERRCFETLLSAHGVGPSLALAVLGVHGPNELVRLIAEEDVSSLCLVPGIGKKTASRLLIELKDSLDISAELDAVNTGTGADRRSAMVEVQEALGGLGYSLEEIRPVLADLAGDDPSVLLREALQRLAVA